MTAADLLQLVVRLLCLEGLLFALEHDEAFVSSFRTALSWWMLGAAFVVGTLAVTAWCCLAALVRWWRSPAAGAPAADAAG